MKRMANCYLGALVIILWFAGAWRGASAATPFPPIFRGDSCVASQSMITNHEPTTFKLIFVNVTGLTNVPVNYQLQATNSPASYDWNTNPPGNWSNIYQPIPSTLTLNKSTGLISGTLPTGATFGVFYHPILVSATNAGGTGYTYIQFTAYANPLPVVTSAETVFCDAGQPFNFTITGTNNPTSFTSSTLPAGLSLNSSTGVISGTPTTAFDSHSSLSIGVSSGGPLTTGFNMMLNVQPAGAPILTNGDYPVIVQSNNPADGSITTDGFDAQAFVGQPFSYQVSGTNNPTSFTATLWPFGGSLPAGLSFNTSTGLLSGTPTAAPGVYAFVMTARTAAGVSSSNLYVVLHLYPAPTNSAPSITSALTATATVGSAFSYTITGSNTPTSFNAAGLPVGLSVNTSTGVISGTPTVAGTSNVTLSATNAAGTGTATLVLTVNSGGSTGPGDLNGDHVVSISDLTLVTSHFGQTSSDPSWDPRADANGDGVVNISDITVVTSNFGKTYP
jgi:hypothetical protein